MSNINDYILWRGDIPISKKYEFNEIDSMILARFSYLRFDKIKLNKKETIKSISNKMKNLKNEEFLYNGDKELITYLGQSERFKNMLVTNYIKNTDKEIEKQFGAVTIHVSDKELYISYIGTDSTINGWKEDFNMAFMENVPCQISGKKYLEEINRKYPDKKIRIGGHSKGGNVAIYSAVTSNQDVQEKIIKVNNYDGPGLNKKIINKYGKNTIINKIETFIPQDSIIGRLLNHKEKTTIVNSIEKGLYQHDIYSWQVLRTDIIKLDKNTQTSEDINNTIKNWLEITKPEQRKIFIDSLFELFSSTEAETFKDISKTLGTSIPKILEEYKTISKEDKKTINFMLKTIMTSYLDVVKDKETTKFENMKQQYLEESKKKKQQFEEKYLNKFKDKK